MRTSAAPPVPTISQRGFTLTELSVVLVIVALLIGGMLMPLSAQQDIIARGATERTLAEIREALIGFAAANGRLPRPATSASDGRERSANCTATPPDDCSGFIPWATLGTPNRDGYEKLIRYSVTPDYANGAISFSSVGNRTVQTRDSAGVAVSLAEKVPAVIYSQGKARWGTTDSGTVLPDGSATNDDEDDNNAGPTNYFSRQATDNTATAGGEFDDIVAWVPSSILMNRMIAAGRLP